MPATKHGPATIAGMAQTPTVDGVNTAWLLVSTALVLLMTPGLALFYGGLNRAKGALNMIMMSFSAIGVVSILWVLYGFSMAFGADRGGLVGDPGAYPGTRTFLAETDLWGATTDDPSGTGIPLYAFMAFQMAFAVVTVALISGAVSDRARFAGWLLFAGGWATLVYFPVAHAVWGGGLLGGADHPVHALDFAGVDVHGGAAALALALVLGRRVGWPRAGFKPHNVPLVALGAGLLWFGWFGFNAGSQLDVDAVTGLAFLNTQLAAAAAVLGWVAVEWRRDRRPTLVGACSGAVAGLVAVTPACGFVAPWAAALLGAVSGVLCALAVGLKYRLRLDDSLDVVGVHFLGGWIGSLWLGLFADSRVNGAITGALGASDGLLLGGGPAQLGRQALASALVTAYSFGVAWALALVIEKTVGFRAARHAEIGGIDIAEHAESAYDLSALPAHPPAGAPRAGSETAEAGPGAPGAGATGRRMGPERPRPDAGGPAPDPRAAAVGADGPAAAPADRSNGRVIEPVAGRVGAPAGG